MSELSDKSRESDISQYNTSRNLWTVHGVLFSSWFVDCTSIPLPHVHWSSGPGSVDACCVQCAQMLQLLRLKQWFTHWPPCTIYTISAIYTTRYTLGAPVLRQITMETQNIFEGIFRAPSPTSRSSTGSANIYHLRPCSNS
jgi:hypothetical protein